MVTNPAPAADDQVVTAPRATDDTAGAEKTAAASAEEIAAAGLRQIQLAFEKGLRSLDLISHSRGKSARETLEPASRTQRGVASAAAESRAALF